MSSVAETIMFLFQADAASLQRGLDKSDSITEKLEKDIISTDDAATALGQTFVGLAKTAGAAFAGLFAANGVVNLINEAAELTNETTRLAERNNMAVESYSALANAVRLTGADMEEFQSGLETFAEKVDKPEEKLRELAKTMEGMTHFQALQLGQELGLSPSTIALIENGVDAYDELIARQKELGVVTEEQAQVAREFQIQQQQNLLVWESVRRSIGLAILPVFTAFIGKLQELGEWVRENQRTVVLFFAAVATAITVAYLPAITAALSATVAFLAPWLGVVALFGGIAAVFALLADDVMAFLDGQDSLIGELSKKWPIIGENVKNIAANVKALFNLLKDFGKFVFDAMTGDPTKAFEEFKTNVRETFATLLDQVPVLREFVADVDGMFAKLGDITGVRLADIKAIVSAWVDGMAALFGFLADLITDGPEAAFENLGRNISAILDDLIAQFPSLGTVVDSVAQGIATSVDVATAAWEGLIAVVQRVVGVVAGAIDSIKSGADTVKGWFTDDEEGQEGVQQAPGAAQRPQALARGDVPLISAQDGQQVGQVGPQGYGPAMPPVQQMQIEQAAAQVDAADSAPLASITSNSISNSNQTRSVSQTIGEVNVHTQATDGEQVAEQLGQTLGDQMRSATDQFDDGVLA